MTTPNRYLLTDYSPAEIAALPDEPLLWWLCWQALGCPVEFFENGAAYIIGVPSNWFNNLEPDVRKPAFDPIMEEIHATVGPNGDHPTTRIESSDRRSVFIIAPGAEWEVRAVADGSPDDALIYLAACRALLAWKRGRG